MNGLQDRRSRYKACMVLAGVGDALGFNDSKWEFCSSGEKIQEEVKSVGGVSALRPTAHKMRVSDDTVMHLATAEAILSHSESHEQLYVNLATCYKQAMREMNGRSPGVICINSVKQLIPDLHMCTVPFNPRGGGCGAAMRAVPIGLLYWRPEQVESLVRVAVEAGRMTHNHPTGFLGSVAVALFISYAVQRKEVREWGEGLLQTLHTAKKYCEEQKRDWKEIEQNWSYFEDQWMNYLNIVMPGLKLNLKPMSAYEYDQFTLKLSYADVPGSSGHDAPMIAYDALLRSMQGTTTSRWENVCRYGMFHGGDSDSTGIIAGACYGAMFGLEGVPLNNYSQLEYRDKLERLGRSLYALTLSDFCAKSDMTLGHFFRDNNKSKSSTYSGRRLNQPFENLTRNDIFKDDSFTNSSALRRGRASHKKKVTFKDMSPARGGARTGEEESKVAEKPDLFILSSMDLDDVVNIIKTKQKSILKRRSRSHSPSRSSEYAVGLDAVGGPNHEKYESREEIRHPKFFPETTLSNIQGNRPHRSLKTNSDDYSFYFPKPTDISTNSTRGISYPPQSPKRRTDLTSKPRVERVIKYPPNYEERRLLDRVIKEPPRSDRSAYPHS